MSKKHKDRRRREAADSSRRRKNPLFSVATGTQLVEGLERARSLGTGLAAIGSVISSVLDSSRAARDKRVAERDARQEHRLVRIRSLALKTEPHFLDKILALVDEALEDKLESAPKPKNATECVSCGSPVGATKNWLDAEGLCPPCRRERGRST